MAQLQYWLVTWLRSSHPRVRYKRIEEFPVNLKPYILYVIGEEQHLWAATMLCPCGCGDVIELNLLKETSPCWSVQLHSDSSVSLMPSVWRSKGCQSHFFLQNGRVDWLLCPT